MGLEVMVSLYSKKVDSMHALTMESVVKQIEKKDSETDIIKKRTKSVTVTTLVSEWEDITDDIEEINEIKNARDIDLFFHKISGLFDASGYNGKF